MGRAPKPQVVSKQLAALDVQHLLGSDPWAAVSLLSMIGQARLSIEDLLGKMSR